MSVLNVKLDFDFFTYCHVQMQLSLRLSCPKGNYNFKVQVMNILMDMILRALGIIAKVIFSLASKDP